VSANNKPGELSY